MKNFRTILASLLIGLTLPVLTSDVTAANKNAPREVVYKFSGTVSDKDFFIPFYTPIEVPKGATRIAVKQSFSRPDGKSCNLDLGVFDSKGSGLNTPGFRGWSGGSRRVFEIAEAEATPGYVPGKVYPGVWNVIQMPTTLNAPEINWALEVTITIGGESGKPFVPKYAARSLNNTPGWYRIDTHIHTVHSDGKNTPQEIIELSKAAELDGIISTDHNTYTSLGHWGYVQDPKVLVINGTEVTYCEGHWNIYDITPETWVDFRYHYTDTASYMSAVRKARQAGKILVMNHPGADSYYDKTPMDGIEVWNGPWDPTDEIALTQWHNLLAAGVKKVATGGSDYHRPGNVIGLPQTVIHANSLSVDHILEGIAAGKSYMTASASVTIDMEAYCEGTPSDKKNIGENLIRTSPAVVSFKANASDCTLKLIDQTGTFYNKPLVSDASTQISVPEKALWVRAEIRDNTGKMIALTNPIFITSVMTKRPLISEK